MNVPKFKVGDLVVRRSIRCLGDLPRRVGIVLGHEEVYLIEPPKSFLAPPDMSPEYCYEVLWFETSEPHRKQRFDKHSQCFLMSVSDYKMYKKLIKERGKVRGS